MGEMKVKLMYSPQYDCLMVCRPIYKGAHYYKFENDPWDYEGTAAHTMGFLEETANFIKIDEWKESQAKGDET